MCGILGYISKQEPVSDELGKKFRQALQELYQRGPDFQNFIQINDKILFGHTRLSIIDTSENANQPFADDNFEHVLVFNGEFYNFQKYRQNLAEVKFKSTGDTEVLFHLLTKHGDSAIEKINGFFSLAFYDKPQNKVLLARDRFGIKPLYFYEDKYRFVFSSELKALLPFLTGKPIDRVSLFTYLQLNYIPAPFTVLKNIRKILPGEKVVIDLNNNKCKTEKYYTLQIPERKLVNVSRSNYENAQKKVRELLRQSVQQRLVTDVPLGAFLSGGIDSSVITALASQEVKNLNTFSIGFSDEPYFDETHYAQIVADKFKTNHTVFKVSNQDLIENLFETLDYIDEPFADSSALAVYILCKKVKAAGIKVALSGDGADEVFSGYNKHHAEYKLRNMGLLAKGLYWLYPLLKILPKSRNNTVTNAIRKLYKLALGAKLKPKERYWLWASIANEEEADFLLKQHFFEQQQRLSDDAYEYKKRKELWLKNIRKNSTDFNEYLLTDVNLVLPNDMLFKVDSMSMANSLEVRVPFLDHHLVEYVFSLPYEFKINSFMKKKLLQDAFKDILPSELYNRPKHGFEVPLLKWFRNELKEVIQNKYLSKEMIEEQGIFNYQAVQLLIKQLHSSNPGDSAARIWALIVFQHWWKKYYLTNE
ncbi:MAG: asparagine synthase (glutamine-hydrolyzing) [Bacteroidetes bacterium]|nr:MAG: asparagine synthase (glutamine-hydrolyzing) [Bacteroidota bacterium]